MRQRSSPLPAHRRGLWPIVALAAAGLAVVVGCRAAPSTDVEVDVRNVGFDQNAGLPVVILQARDGGRILPIWIGTAEAQAIAMEMQKVAPPRPMTHDLVKRILDSTGVALRRVRITDLQGQTFLATLVLDQRGREVEIDSRPSDAIALALRVTCPILVSRTLLESAAASPLGGGLQGIAVKIWGLTVQDLSPTLADSLGLAELRGVLISDVDGGDANSERPRRGDVIVAVDGTPVPSVADLQAVAESRPSVRQLEVRRGTARLVLQFDPKAG